MRIYYLNFENFEGDTWFELYHSKEKAYKRYTNLRAASKKMEEFCDEIKFNKNNEKNRFSFFNADYNEYSTFITIEQIELEDLFYDNIID